MRKDEVGRELDPPAKRPLALGERGVRQPAVERLREESQHRVQRRHLAIPDPEDDPAPRVARIELDRPRRLLVHLAADLDLPAAALEQGVPTECRGESRVGEGVVGRERHAPPGELDSLCVAGRVALISLRLLRLVLERARKREDEPHVGRVPLKARAEGGDRAFGVESGHAAIALGPGGGRVLLREGGGRRKKARGRDDESQAPHLHCRYRITVLVLPSAANIGSPAVTVEADSSAGRGRRLGSGPP